MTQFDRVTDMGGVALSPVRIVQAGGGEERSWRGWTGLAGLEGLANKRPSRSL